MAEPDRDDPIRWRPIRIFNANVNLVAVSERTPLPNSDGSPREVLMVTFSGRGRERIIEQDHGFYEDGTWKSSSGLTPTHWFDADHPSPTHSSSNDSTPTL